MGQNYQINQFGEIVQEDYSFQSVKGDGVQILPSNRKVWKILLLTIVTLGIYAIVLLLAMIKETNVACKEDGKHTRGFWGAIGLSIITLGIYGIVWGCKWLNREYSFLLRHNHNGILSGKGYLVYFFFIIIAQCLQSIFSYEMLMLFNSGYYVVLLVCSIIQQIIAIYFMTLCVRQHNMVCRIYNDINNLVRKA